MGWFGLAKSAHVEHRTWMAVPIQGLRLCSPCTYVAQLCIDPPFTVTRCIGALGAASKVTASIDATTRLFDDQRIGRRREPRHPLGAGERDDLERLRREAKKQRQGYGIGGRLRLKLSSDDDDEAVGDPADELVAVHSEEDADQDNPEGGIDMHAEAGGMGLLLMPLTPDDMRSNYPRTYVDELEENIDVKAGAVSLAADLESQMKGIDKSETQDPDKRI